MAITTRFSTDGGGGGIEGLDISISGFGTFDMQEGYDAPLIYLEVDPDPDGETVLYVWPDINEQDPIKIDLSKARWENREEEDETNNL